MPEGAFITFEGGDGAGKSTLLLRIWETLREEGTFVISTPNPKGSLLGDNVRTLLAATRPHCYLSPQDEAFLFLAARSADIREVIAPFLEQGAVVLCDRYNDSTVAYQGCLPLCFNDMEYLCNTFLPCPVPDLTLYLDVPPSVGLVRAGKRSALDVIEMKGLAWHDNVRVRYRRLLEENPERIKLIDATQSQDVVFEEALKWVKECIAKKRESHDG
jgi:dTMP kinase